MKVGLGVDDVRGVLGKGFGKRRRVKVSRINQSGGTLTRKMDYAAVKTEGAIKFRPHRSTDLLCSVFLLCQFNIRSFAIRFICICFDSSFERNWTGLSEKSTDTIFI